MLENIDHEIKDIKELVEFKDESLQEEIKDRIRVLEKRIAGQEFNVFLSGKYDRNNAIMEIFSGAGGQDAQDWATMLLRMYLRYCEKKGLETKIIEQSFGEAGGPEGRIGIKSATLEINGKYAYGFLKKESGVHRLVRQSPFSAKSLRHTCLLYTSPSPRD